MEMSIVYYTLKQFVIIQSSLTLNYIMRCTYVTLINKLTINARFPLQFRRERRRFAHTPQLTRVVLCYPIEPHCYNITLRNILESQVLTNDSNACIA